MMYKKITIAVFALAMLGFGILTAVFAPKERIVFSENENRYLAALPKFSISSVGDKKFMDGIQKCVNDRFFRRIDLIRLRNETERALGKTEIADVFTKNGRMIEAFPKWDEAKVAKSLDAVEKFAERHSGVPVYFALAPSSQELFRNLLPKSAPLGDELDFSRYCAEALPSVRSVDIFDAELAHKDEYLFYRTDHHWTTLGAYYAYSAMGEALGYTPHLPDEYRVEHASGSFRGTLYSKTLDLKIQPDDIDFYTLRENPPKLTLTVMTGDSETTQDSLYFRDYLDKKDKYSAFLGANSPVMTINVKNADSDKSLLIFKDSYAHCLIPFLTAHYKKITILDMRYINVGYDTLVNANEFDGVLFLYNAITFSNDTDVKKLNYVDRTVK